MKWVPSGKERDIMEYAVFAETHNGTVGILRAGFPTEDDANDFPVRLRDWKRVWVEAVDRTSVPVIPAVSADNL
jgi:hypothetical protein